MGLEVKSILDLLEQHKIKYAHTEGAHLIEVWNNQKKLSIYYDDDPEVIRVWGTNIVHEMGRYQLGPDIIQHIKWLMN